IFKIVSTAVRSGTSGDSSVACTIGIVTVEGVIATVHIFTLQALVDNPLNQLP
ncbi:hypothetical protein Tco_0081326, partial [Tanacetum coccineum]